MKLVIFIHSLSSGGAERVTANLSNYWARRGWQVTVVTLAPSSKDFYALHPAVRRLALDLAGDSCNLCSAAVSNLRRVRALRQMLVTLQPDVALGMMTSANVLLALAATGMRRTVRVGSEHTHPPMQSLGALWERLRACLYARLDAVVALTQESAVWLREHTGARRIAVIPNAVAWPMAVQEPGRPWPAALDGRRVLLAVGRLSKEKQFELLLRVFRALANDFPDWSLVILGEGPKRSDLEAQIRAMELQHRVLLPGRAGNVGQWYEKAELYAMSSLFEGFPNTLAEALAYGLPAVSFDCDTGPRHLIRHEVDGLLVPPDDEAALESALRSLMGDESLRRRMGARAVDARERFAMDMISERWEQLFAELESDKSHMRHS